ncbi:MAG TPA: hypothetical protein VEC99_03440, partial [Clostridia bacterium]|nr:hypothetical protein [Clostridia bacterium]
MLEVIHQTWSIPDLAIADGLAETSANKLARLLVQGFNTLRMQLLLNRLLLSALAVFSISTTSFAGDFLIRDGDRVVFLGDSITEQRLYTTYIEAYALTRYPQWKLSFRNVGWGGDTSWLRQRMHPN